MMKASNFNGSPRTLGECHFADYGCAVERPMPRRALWAVAAWVAVTILVVLALGLIASGGRV